MRITTKEIRNGAHVGEIVWVCHYNRPDMQKKPLRNIPPTKCIVRSNDELPKNKRVYYSANHFSPLGKNGNPSSRVISPVDNTGFRMRPGNELYVFDNEADCKKSWNSQLLEHIKVLDKYIESAADHWRAEKKLLVDAVVG